MGNFNRSNGSGRGRSFGNKREFGNRNFSRPALFKTVCSKCLKECEVPFKPTGEKPVFCRECFRENGGGDRKPDERNFSRPNFDNRNTENPQYKEQFAALNAKLDKILDILTAAISQETPAEVTQPIEQVAPEKKKRASKKAL